MKEAHKKFLNHIEVKSLDTSFLWSEHKKAEDIGYSRETEQLCAKSSYFQISTIQKYFEFYPDTGKHLKKRLIIS